MTKVAKYVELPLRADKVEEFRVLLEANRQHTKIEPGTLEWAIYAVDGKPSSVAMFEVYEDESASAEHDTSPALAPILERLGEFLDGDPVIVNLRYERGKYDD
ncbi:putative quinol monooxygenase [Microbacterium sp. F2]|uniref:putative quinol monooxygenase n=1 Tax=Microbacterium sp. F2 TaxID=3422228 RepID=UPI003FD1B110